MFQRRLVIEKKSARDKIYRFECDEGAYLGEAHDILCEIKNEIINQIQMVQNQEKQMKKPQEVKQESSCEASQCQEVQNEKPCAP